MLWPLTYARAADADTVTCHHSAMRQHTVSKTNRVCGTALVTLERKGPGALAKVWLVKCNVLSGIPARNSSIKEPSQRDIFNWRWPWREFHAWLSNIESHPSCVNVCHLCAIVCVIVNLCCEWFQTYSKLDETCLDCLDSVWNCLKRVWVCLTFLRRFRHCCIWFRSCCWNLFEIVWESVAHVLRGVWDCVICLLKRCEIDSKHFETIWVVFGKCRNMLVITNKVFWTLRYMFESIYEKCTISNCCKRFQTV